LKQGSPTHIGPSYGPSYYPEDMDKTMIWGISKRGLLSNLKGLMNCQMFLGEDTVSAKDQLLSL